MNMNMKKKTIPTGAKIAIILIVLVAVVAIIAVIATMDESDLAPTSKGDIQYIEINAEDLYSEFSANEVAADAKYKDKYVKVTGKVTEISSAGTFTQACILLNVEQTLIYGDVQCNFSNDDAVKKIAEIKKGDTVTVTGICKGLDSINLIVNNCEIQ